ncbi:hypothetical protein Tco_1314348 [Tanacetum coccineum]
MNANVAWIHEKYKHRQKPYRCLDIDDFDLHLTLVLRSSSSAHVETISLNQSNYHNYQSWGVASASLNSICVEPSSSTPNPVRIIPGPDGFVQRAKLLKENIVENMLDNGIQTWEPTYDLTKVIRFPESGTGLDTHADGIRADGIRAYCIQEMLHLIDLEFPNRLLL